MRFLEFIREAEVKDKYQMHNVAHGTLASIPKLKDPHEVIEFLKSYSSEMIKAYRETDVVLLRGDSANAGPIVATHIRPDRRPVDMRPERHEMLHDAYQKLGLKATRKNSIFCTTNKKTAENWGTNVYIIFLKDGWDGNVLRKVSRFDYSYYALNTMSGIAMHNYAIGKTWDSQIDYIADEIRRLDPYEFSDAQSLKTVLLDRFMDIIITGESYIGLDINSSMASKILAGLDLQPENLVLAHNK